MTDETHDHDFQAEGEDAWLDMQERKEGTAVLAKMSGVKSNHRNMKAEDAAASRNVDLHEREQFGDEAVDAATKAAEDEKMEIMAARDVYYNEKPVADQEPPPSPVGPTQPIAGQPSQRSSSSLSSAQRAALAAALAAGGLGLGAGGLTAGGIAGYLLNQYLNPPANPSEQAPVDVGLLPADPVE